ncbi:MAG: type II toxin-antitoxin system RelE/ParE family toxin [Candidatus Sulfotelmatobacter sp.]
MAYTIQFKPPALRQLEKLPREAQRRLAAKIEALREEPFPPGCKKMAAVPDTWRIRTGDYRVVYQVHRGVLLVLVLAVGHRREVYR